MESLWWKQPLRVIQTNLQVKDTPGMDPRKIVQEMKAMHANTLVTNVGGIYAWYPSDVPYHHINEYLPQGRDLLRELIDECHANGMRLIARFDFSKTDDTTFQSKPAWFTRDLEGKPRIIGKDRFGPWSLLLSTCINGGYRNAEFAVPVLEEVVSRYDIDGIFFNAPHYERCHCEICKAKYRDVYGEELPEDPAMFHEDWTSICLRDNIGLLREAVKANHPDMPVILYYNLYRDNLIDRTATADMICTEPQDVLSLGWKNIPQSWKPALAVRMGRTAKDIPNPFGIIHSCPGMDWRHTGLPTAEYRYWLAQVPANGGMIWHSITGYPDTITDKRILESVGEVNAAIEKTESLMQGARSAANTVLLWNAKPSAEGLAEGLLAEHVQFDLLDTYQVTAESLRPYRVAILPNDYPMTDAIAEAIEEYTAGGGKLLAESADPAFLSRYKDWFGIQTEVVSGEALIAAYLRIEDDALRAGGFEHTDLLPHRGKVAYVRPVEGSRVLATLVPPFAPPDAVGAPPERASIPTPQTDLPLVLMRPDGKTLLLPYALSALLSEFRLAEHSRLLAMCVRMLTGGQQVVMDGASGVQAMLYEREDGYLLHLVNGTGQRPLRDGILLRDLAISVRLPGKDEYTVTSVIAGASVAHRRRGSRLYCVLSSLDTWDMLYLQKV